MTRVPDSVVTTLATNPAIARVMGASRRRMLTTLMLSPPVEAMDLIGWFRSEIVSGRFSPEPDIIFSLFRALDRKERIGLAASACGSALDSASFVKLMSKVYRDCSPRGLERLYLAQAISRHASFYRDISTTGFAKLARQLLYSRRLDECMHGVLCLESLSGVHPELCRRLAQLVRNPSPQVRSNAWYSAHALLYRDRLSPEARQLLMRASEAAIKDKDKFVRDNARLFRQRASQKSKRGPRPSISIGFV